MTIDDALRRSFSTIMSHDVVPGPSQAHKDSQPHHHQSAQDTQTFCGVVEVHAELLARFFLADGLLEVLEWTREGLPADPLACMWLGLLRWHRTIRGGLPDNAPVPPSRRTEEQLSAALESGRLRITPDSARPALDAVGTGEMGYPSSPAGPQNAEDHALLRLHPIAVVPFIDETMRMAWVDQALGLTHGDPQLNQRARDYVAALHRQASVPNPDDGAPAAAASPPDASTGREHPLTPVITDLATRWWDITDNSR